LSSTAELCRSASSVAGIPTIIGDPTVTRTSSRISPTYQLKQIWTQQLQHSVDSKVLTPLCSNRAYKKQPCVIKADKEFSPLICTSLNYSKENCSLEVAHEDSPVVVVARVPKGYQIMDDDYSLLEYPDSEVEGDESSLNECTVADSIEEAVLVQVETLDLNAMAKSIADDALDPNISEEELKLIMSSSVNTKVYEKSRSGVENRFFDTIAKYGGDTLKPLVMFADDGFQKERVFYMKLRGDRSEVKRFILNKCLVKIALKWRNNNKRSQANFGKHLQPSTWNKLLKILFSNFHKKNINYHYANDFNGEGEFHSVLMAQWTKMQEEDPTFASGTGTATFDMNADYKIREHFRSGKFNPFSTALTEEAYKDRLKYAIYVLGRYFLCRGRSEIAFCCWDQVKFHETIVNGEKEEFVEVVHKWDKTHKMSLQNPTSRDVTSQVSPRIYANGKDDLCPHRFLKFLRGLCPPEQERVLCSAGNKTMLKQYRSGKGKYMYNPKLPVGENTVGPLCKEMAEEMGFERWEKCTGHGLRKMGITNAMTYAETNIAPVVLGASRHKNYQTSLAYQKPNDDMYRSYNKAIKGKHGSSPPKKKQRKKSSGNCKSIGDNDKLGKTTKEDKLEEDDLVLLQSNLISSCTNTFNDGTDVSKVTSNSVEEGQYERQNIVTLNRGITSDVSMNSGTVSSISGLVSEKEILVPDRELAIMPQQLATAQYQRIVPQYSMQSNHIQRNIIVQPYHYDLQSGINEHNEERKEWESKVKELEMKLAHQKERYDEIKQDLREVRKDGSREEKPIVISTCVIL